MRGNKILSLKYLRNGQNENHNNFQTLIITIVTSNFQFSTKKFLISPLKIPEPFLGQFINLLVATWFVSYDCHDCDIE